MKRTTIFADESLLKALREIASKEHTSVSAAIRAALEEYAGRRRPARTLPSFLGLGRSGRKDIAEHAEEFLWTNPHKVRKQ
jgi:hypothetical protein